MKVYCKTCKRILGAIPDEKIPPNVRRYVNCRTCGEKILLYRKADAPPNESVKEGEKKPAADSDASRPSSVQKAKPLATSGNAPGKPERTILKLRFSGSAGEYFRIWIINVFLTIVTFGVYAAWAKVRTRRYFYAHTKLEGYPFDYLADPFAILKGNLILGSGLVLYSSSDLFYPGLGTVIAAFIGLIFPFLVYKSLRFYAHNSSYRNIRFNFRGELRDSYFIYLLIPLLIPFTFGLITPYWEYRRKEYFFNNFAFGTSRGVFSGRVAPFYRVYTSAAVISILAGAGGAILFFGLGANFIPALISGTASLNSGNIGQMVIAGAILFYLTIMLLFTTIQQYLFVRLTNYCWHHARLRKIYFKSGLEVRKLVWIRITNIIAIIFSLGLLAPWAKVRRARYILNNLTLVAYCRLNEFRAAVAEEESALGNAATDFFDFEIGL